MGCGDEGGVVVGDDGSGVFGEAVEGIVWIGLPGAEVEGVADAALFEAGGGLGNSFENEGMQSAVGLAVAAGQGFVKQNREVELVGEIDGVGQAVIAVDPAIHLAPVQDVLCVGSDWGLVEGADSIFYRRFQDVFWMTDCLQTVQ